MKSIFNPVDQQEFIERINRLHASSKSEWGKMSVAQMLAHCQMPLKAAMGEIKIKRGLIGILFGGIAKKKLLGPGNFDRHLPTDKSFIIHDNRIFEHEKGELVKLIQRISKTGIDGLSNEPHPFFGKMTPQEWDALQVKHLDHHLRQFGA